MKFHDFGLYMTFINQDVLCEENRGENYISIKGGRSFIFVLTQFTGQIHFFS